MRFLDWRTGGRDWPLREHSRFVTVGPLTWHVQRLGDGPAVLLLHGTGASTHSWRDVAPLLAERFMVLSLDLPGHGFTRGRLATGMRLPGIAQAVRDLLTAEQVSPVVVAGHSAGAAISIQLATPDAPIVAFAPAVRPMGGEAAPMFSGLARLLFANPFTPFFAAGAARFGVNIERFLQRSTGSRLDARGVDLYARLFASPAHCEGALGMMANWELAALARALPALPVPITIAHGDRDAAVPIAEGREVARITGGRLEVMAGLGHLAHEERPDLAAAIIARTATGEAA